MRRRKSLWRLLLDGLIGVPDPQDLLHNSKDHRLRYFFPSSSVTDSQLEALRRFQQLQQQAFDEFFAAGPGRRPHGSDSGSSDLLIMGGPQSGKTNTLIACLTFAAWVLGHDSLLVVTEVSAERQVLDKLHSVAGGEGLDILSLISIASLNDTTFAQWLHQSHRLPHITVATWCSLERLCLAKAPTPTTSSAPPCDATWPLIAVDDVRSFSQLPALVDFRDRQRKLSVETRGPCQILWTVTASDEWAPTDFAIRDLRWPEFREERNGIRLVP